MAAIIETMNATESSVTWRIYGNFDSQTTIIGQAQFAEIPAGRLKTALTTPIGPAADKVAALRSRLSELGFTMNAGWSGYVRYSEGMPYDQLNGCFLGVDLETDLPRLELPMNGSFLYPDDTPRSNTFVTAFIRYSASE